MVSIHLKPKHELNYGGSYISIFHANKGEGLEKHSHEFNHASMCVSGSCKYTENGKELIANKNTPPINLMAGKFHEIEALEDNTVFINVQALEFQNKYLK
jgi:quercetin dioxygenase-like cupin family protein